MTTTPREGGEAVLRFFEVRRTEQFEHDVHGLETCDVLAQDGLIGAQLTQFLWCFFGAGDRDDVSAKYVAIWTAAVPTPPAAH